MGHYEDNLRHVARPDADAERARSPQTTLTDHEALYLARLLREYASYHATRQEREIAWAYVEYIDLTVREEERLYIVLYAHTERAVNLLEQAVTKVNGAETEMQRGIRQSIDLLRAEVYE